MINKYNHTYKFFILRVLENSLASERKITKGHPNPVFAYITYCTYYSRIPKKLAAT